MLDARRAQRLRRALRDPLLTYRPGPPQLACLRDQARIRLLRAPSQSGKTTSAAWDLVQACLGTHPWRPNKGGPIAARVVCHSYQQSLVVQAKIHAMVPEGAYDPETVYHPVRGYRHRTIRFRNGSHVMVHTTSQERLALASATLDYVWIDEPPPPSVYAECASRIVQTGGSLILTMTPVGRPLGWLREEVERDGSPISEHHYGLSVEACPWMTQAQVDEAIQHCLPSQRPQVIRGEWDGVTPDRYLSGWTDDRISSEPPSAPGGLVDVLLGMDYGERPGSTVCHLIYSWADSDGRGHAHVWDSYVSTTATTPMDDAYGISDMLERNDLSLASVDRAVGDVNSAGKAAARGGRSVNDHMTRALAAIAGTQHIEVQRPRKGPGSVVRGARSVNVALLEDRLRVHPRCAALIETGRHWQGKDDDLKHAFDALSYGVADRLEIARVASPLIRVG